MATPLHTASVSELRHELRTPVNLIVGYAEMLLEDCPESDPRSTELRGVVVAAREVLGRINAALPPNGVSTENDLTRLLEELVDPQQRVMRAVATVSAATQDERALADLEKITAAARRLTSVPRPATHPMYAPTSRPGPIDAPASVGPGATTAVNGVARILIVDDVEDNRTVLARRLARQGYQTFAVENGRLALERLSDGSFDLVLLDVMMPEMDGIAVLERMKASPALRDIPVIMISALDDLSSVVRCIEQGAEDYLAKPFDPVLLRARIGAALEKKRLHDREADYLRQVGCVIEAAGAVERGQYRSDLLTAISRRDDELGRLARVFDAMVAGVRAREGRLHAQLHELRADVKLATSEMTVAWPDGEYDAALPRPGSLFAGRYEVSRVLGRGGMGTVFQAHDRELGEDVAIKLVRSELLRGDDAAIDRFKNEIRLARRISHRNVVRTHDFGESAGEYFVTMEYVRGMTVRELLRTRGRLGASSTLGLARQLVEALAVAHEAGIIHRDIKPENALLDGDGVLKVMDFGIARLAQRSSTVTQTGMFLGTPTYMAPEHLLGEDIDARADLYAVGVTMYECLTGVPPFTAPSAIALISKVLATQPAAPVAVNPEVPPAMSALVLRLLAKHAGDRPRDARDLLELLAEMG
jgi:CheY-like chemotaxis protein/predicted Ser/Thr protein kinase